MTDQVPSKDLSLELRSALRDARWYVEQYEPKDVSEAHDRDLLLTSIDSLLGAAPEPGSALPLALQGALGRLSMTMGNPAVQWSERSCIEAALVEEAIRRLAQPPSAEDLIMGRGDGG